MSSGSALEWLVPVLMCPEGDGGRLEADETALGGDGFLQCDECRRRYPVIRGVPRLLRANHLASLVARERAWVAEGDVRQRWAAQLSGTVGQTDAVVDSFDYEWSMFRRVRTRELGKLFEDYFDLIDARAFAKDALVIDAGCGAGRWAAEVSARGPRVIAVDLGASIDVARANTDAMRVGCVQADVRALPIRSGAADWAYSLGVLHHIDDPVLGLREVARCLCPGGTMLLYLYYALENRGAAYRALFRVASAVRRVTSRMPRPAALAFAAIATLVAYWPLARTARIVAAVRGEDAARSVPLSFYRRHSLLFMFNDSLDRFGTSVEQRFTQEQMRALMARAGLADVAFSIRSPYWHAIGRRAAEV